MLTGGVVGPRGRVVEIALTTYTLLADDNSLALSFTNPSGCVVKVPAGLPIGYGVEIYQASTGQVSFATDSGVTLNNLDSQNSAAGQWARLYIRALELNVLDLSGDVANALGSPVTLGVTIYTLTPANNNGTLVFTSNTDVTLNVPFGLPFGFRVTTVANGTGALIPTAAPGVTISNSQSFVKTSGQFATMNIIGVAQDVYILSFPSGDGSV